MSNEGLLARKTRVLVTHTTDILSQVDYIVVLKEGKVAEFGIPHKMMNGSSELSLFLEELDETERLAGSVENIKEEINSNNRNGNLKPVFLLKKISPYYYT